MNDVQCTYLIYLSICLFVLSICLSLSGFQLIPTRLHNPTYYATTWCSRWPTLQHHHLLVQGWEETDPENQLNAKHQYNLCPWKLTWHWKIPIFNRKYIFKWWSFHRHVSFLGCKSTYLIQSFNYIVMTHLTFVQKLTDGSGGLNPMSPIA